MARKTASTKSARITARLCLVTAMIAASAALGGEIRWIGGDTLASGEPDTFGIGTNWEGGAAPDVDTVA